MPIPVTIADDSLLSRKTVRKALPADWEIDLTEVCNGKEALAAVAAGKADVLFLDLTMPELDGFAVLRELHDHHAKTVVIVISADIQPQARKLVESLGAYRFLSKPLQPEQLRQTLSELGVVMNLQLTELQRDALQELMNISMGQAANALAQLIDAKITLSIPKISLVGAAEFQQIFCTDRYWFTRQSFLGSVKGEVLTLLARAGTETIGGLLDYALPLDERSEKELLLELANILAGACLSGFSTQLALPTKVSMPTMFHAELRQADSFRWSSTLLLEVEFQLEGTAFDSRIVICLEQQAVAVLLEKLNKLLED